jgi:hypothetical protein
MVKAMPTGLQVFEEVKRLLSRFLSPHTSLYVYPVIELGRTWGMAGKQCLRRAKG